MVPGRDVSDDEEQQALRRWHRYGAIIEQVIVDFHRPDRFALQPDSQMDADDKALAPYGALYPVVLLLNAGLDHLHAAKKLVVDSQTINTALYSLSRGAIENLAAANWLLTPDNQRERLKRYLSYYGDDGDKANLARSSIGQPKTTATRDRLRFIAKANGIDWQRQRWSSTNVVRDTGKAVALPGLLAMWQICSGYAHGRSWAITNNNELRPVGDPERGVYASTPTAKATLEPMAAALFVWQATVPVFDARRRYL